MKSEMILAISLGIVFISVFIIFCIRTFKQMKLDAVKAKEFFDGVSDEFEFKTVLQKLVESGNIIIKENDCVFTMIYEPKVEIEVIEVSDKSLLLANRKVAIQYLDSLLKNADKLELSKENEIDREAVIYLRNYLEDKNKVSGSKFITNESMSEKIKMR